MSADLNALAARVESLEGPDREVDEAILRSVGGFTPTGLPTWRGGLGWPMFTQSLDAAMSLVPEGWHWQRQLRLHGRYHSEVGNGQTTYGKSARTPALALCAAALKARAGGGG